MLAREVLLVARSELIAAVASKLGTKPHCDVELGVNTVFMAMAEALVEEERIDVRDFGSPAAPRWPQPQSELTAWPVVAAACARAWSRIPTLRGH